MIYLPYLLLLSWLLWATLVFGKDCPKEIEKITNGFVEEGDVLPGSFRKIHCHVGFAITGANVVFCYDGRWSEPGTCISTPEKTKKALIKCPNELPVVFNGYVEHSDGGDVTPGARRTVKCNPPFHVVGRDFIYCDNLGVWSSPGICNTEKVFIVYPGGGKNYSDGERKCWDIKVTQGHIIKFQITFDDIFDGGMWRGQDRLQLYDVTGDSSDLIYGPIFANLEGLVFYSHHNLAKLCFVSNNDRFTGKGFRLFYEPYKVEPVVDEVSIVDCETLKLEGHSVSGEYTIFPLGRDRPGQRAYCDMTSHGGGWTVIQRRVDGMISFAQPWGYYKNGFGNLTSDFWLGNQVLHDLTKRTGLPRERYYTLLIKVETTDGRSGFVHFNHFFVDSETEHYRIHFNDVPICNSTITKWISAYHNHRIFSTKDMYNYYKKTSNCSDRFGGAGWWFESFPGCHIICLNGILGKDTKFGVGMWGNFGPTDSEFAYLLKTEMMIRRTKMDKCQL